jgi:hypothetical protein
MDKHRSFVPCVIAVVCLTLLQGHAQQEIPPRDTQRLLFENSYVRVFEIRMPPGASEARHSHARAMCGTVRIRDSSSVVRV